MARYNTAIAFSEGLRYNIVSCSIIATKTLYLR